VQIHIQKDPGASLSQPVTGLEGKEAPPRPAVSYAAWSGHPTVHAVETDGGNVKNAVKKLFKDCHEQYCVPDED
jgi:hypothetical protein